MRSEPQAAVAVASRPPPELLAFFVFVFLQP